jgi:hypothetical protein
VFIVQAYQTSQHVVPRGGIFLFQNTRCSLCRLIRLLTQYVVPRGGIFLGKWRSYFAGNSDGKINVQSAYALNTLHANRKEIFVNKFAMERVKGDSSDISRHQGK